MVMVLRAFFGSYFLYYLFKPFVKDLDTLLRYMVYAVFLQCVLCCLIKSSLTVFSFFDAVQVYEFSSLEEKDIVYRLFGIGNAMAFGALPMFSIGILSSAYLVIQSRNLTTKVLFIIFYLIILVVSYLVVRTSVIIGVMSILYLLFSIRAFSPRNLLFLFLFIIFLFIIVSVFGVYAIIVNYLNEDIFKWAFDIDRELDHGTASVVIDWWANTGFEPSTFWVGDAQYTSKIGYYKGVDIGYFRIVFYGGVFGLILLLYYHFIVLWSIIKRHQKYSSLFFLFFFSYLIILAKGDTIMLSYFIMIHVFCSKGIVLDNFRSMTHREQYVKVKT